MYNDIRDPVGPVRSATEVAITQRELASRIGSSFGRIQNEALVKILNASAAVLKRIGFIPDVVIDGSDVAVKFTSPLSRAQDMQDLEVMQRSVAMTAQLAGPEAVAASYKVDDFGSFIGMKTGLDPSLIRSDEEKQVLMQQMAQMQMAQMQQGAEDGGEAIQ